MIKLTHPLYKKTHWSFQKYKDLNEDACAVKITSKDFAEGALTVHWFSRPKKFEIAPYFCQSM